MLALIALQLVKLDLKLDPKLDPKILKLDHRVP